MLNLNYFTILSLYSQYPVLSNAALTHRNVSSSYQISVLSFLSLDKLGSDELKLNLKVLYILSPIFTSSLPINSTFCSIILPETALI